MVNYYRRFLPTSRPGAETPDRCSTRFAATPAGPRLDRQHAGQLHKQQISPAGHHPACAPRPNGAHCHFRRCLRHTHWWRLTAEQDTRLEALKFFLLTPTELLTGPCWWHTLLYSIFRSCSSAAVFSYGLTTSCSSLPWSLQPCLNCHAGSAKWPILQSLLRTWCTPPARATWRPTFSLAPPPTKNANNLFRHISSSVVI